MWKTLGDQFCTDVVGDVTIKAGSRKTEITQCQRYPAAGVVAKQKQGRGTVAIDLSKGAGSPGCEVRPLN